MAKVNLSQAAKLTGKNRTTIWRHIHSGKLSIDRDRDGLPFVDTSELIRVYGELEPIATDGTQKKPHEATLGYEDLVATIELLRKEQAEMKKQINDLTKRITYKPEPTINTEKRKAEDDPRWPKAIINLSDIILRQEIKSEYQ